MCKIGKPVTQNMADKCNKAYLYLKRKGDYVTKEELGEYLGIANERSVRDVISTLSTRVPIIATSDNKGYKLAQRLSDLEAVEHEWKDIDSRQASLEQRKTPLIAFREKCLKGEIE